MQFKTHISQKLLFKNHHGFQGLPIIAGKKLNAINILQPLYWWTETFSILIYCSPLRQNKMFLSFHFLPRHWHSIYQVRSQKFCPIIQWNPTYLLLNRLFTYLFIFLASKMSCKPHKCVARVIFLYYEGLMIFGSCYCLIVWEVLRLFFFSLNLNRKSPSDSHWRNFFS